MSSNELAHHLQLARQRSPQMRVFAFSDNGNAPLPEELQVAEEWWQVVRADSEIAIRDALVNQPEDRLLALVTRLSTGELAFDVRARIKELLAFDPWESLKPAFQATRFDVRLRSNRALGSELLRRAATAKFRPTTTGVLSVDEAWGAYFQHVLKLEVEPTEIEGWVRWIIDNPKRTAALLDNAELFPQLVDRAVDRCGEAVRLVFDAVSAAVSDRVDIAGRLHALAHVVDAAHTAGGGAHSGDALKVLTRLERYFNGTQLDDGELRTFVSEVRRTPADDRLGTVIDQLLDDNHAKVLAVYSDFSAYGFAERQRALGEACQRHLRGEASGDELTQRLEQLAAHHDFGRKSDGEHVRALVRLALRVADAGETEHPSSCGDLARAYIDEQSFIDALREELEFSDLGTELARARQDTLDAAYAYSTARNKAFAHALTAAIATGPTVRGAHFTHQMLGEVLAPLAAERSVLLLVIDGLSWFVLRRLGFDPSFEGWNAALPTRDDVTMPMFATLPSITNFSRCALLTGTLQTGGQAVEKAGFAGSPALAARLKGKRAVLFHKGELDADGKGQVGHEVARALGESKNRVVGVVLNGVDDQLGGADQLSFDWRVDAIPPLRSLLELAETHQRDVLIVADHGHIWDRTSGKTDSVSASARFRLADNPGEGEVRVAGPIIEAFGEKSVVLPYDEAIRYTGGKRGYHGGISLQEVVAPCVLLTRTELPADGWARLSLAKPAWWEFRQPETVREARQVFDSPQGSLFSPPPAPTAPWIDQLLRVSAFEERRKTFAANLTPQRIEALLGTLDANGCRAHVNTLQDATGLTAARLQRTIPALQRLLGGPDGAAVLATNDGIVSLDLDLLKKQFHLT